MSYINNMEGQKYIQTTMAYLEYLQEHLDNVKLAFNTLSDDCQDMAWVIDDYTWHTLREEVIYHDLSKFSKEEFVQYRDSFFPVCDKDKKNSDFKSAWENHKKENHHHHETIKTDLDIVHMVIDWTAMGYRHKDTAQDFYESHKSEIDLTDEQEKFMYEIFGRITGR